MDRRVKERLVGASILVVLIVLIVPELLSGPPRTAANGTPGGLPVNAPEPVRNVTVDLATSKAPAPETVDVAAAASAPPETPSAPAAGVSTPGASTPGASTASGGTPSTVSAPVETAARPPTSAGQPAKPALAGRAWAVQLGSFQSRDNADKLLHQLKAQGFSVYVLSGGSGPSLRYRVRIGPMADRAAAAQEAAKLQSLRYAASIVPPAT